MTCFTLQPIVALETVRLVLYHKPALISRKKDSSLMFSKIKNHLYVAFHVFARGLSRPNTTHTHAYNHTYRHTHNHAYQLPLTTCCQVVMSGGSFVCRNQGWGEVLFKVLKLSTSTFILNLSISISTLSFFVQYLSTFTSTNTGT